MREICVILFLLISIGLLVHTTKFIDRYYLEKFQTEQLPNLRYIPKCKDRSNTWENQTVPSNGERLVLQSAYPRDIYMS